MTQVAVNNAELRLLIPRNDTADLFNGVSTQNRLTLLLLNLNAITGLSKIIMHVVTLTVLETRIINSLSHNENSSRCDLLLSLSDSYCSRCYHSVLAASKILLLLYRPHALQKHSVVLKLEDGDALLS